MTSLLKKIGCNKYSAAIFCIVLILIVSTTAASAIGPGIMPGDVNDDGTIDVLDVTIVMKYVLDLEPMPEELKALADINQDGEIDVQDATLIMQRALAPVVDERLVQANNGFGFNIFHELIKDEEEDENIFISPSSIMSALAMTYNGAEGETREAMKQTLLFQDMTRNEVNSAYDTLLTILQETDPKVEMTVANSLWAREGIDFKEDFLQRNMEYFNAEVDALDFDDPESVDIINNWVSEKTRGKIKGIVEPPIDPLTVLFLINAIYFKGDWSEPFDLEKTEEIPFKLQDGSEIEHPVMFQDGNYLYLENDLFQAVRLPYGNYKQYSMYVFLPSKEAGLEKFYAELKVENWDEWVNSFGAMEVEVGLPRFKFEYDTSLNKVLEVLGMEIAFDETAADFSGMRDIPPRLYISDVKHKSFVEVNEEGTEAAAVTAVETGIVEFVPPLTMTVDRPFFFAIVDDVSRNILFMGSVVEPTEE